MSQEEGCYGEDIRYIVGGRYRLRAGAGECLFRRGGVCAGAGAPHSDGGLGRPGEAPRQGGAAWVTPHHSGYCRRAGGHHTRRAGVGALWRARAGRALRPAVGPYLSPALVGAETSTALATGFTLMVITYLLVVLSELVPKAIALQYTDQVAILVAQPMQLAVRVFTPFVWSMNALGNGILRLLRLPPPDAGDGVYSVEELQLLIVQSHQAGILEDIERHPLATTPRLGCPAHAHAGRCGRLAALEQRLEQRRADRAGVGQTPQYGDGKTRRGEAGRVARGKLWAT